jgi:hypothetical protein
MSIRGRAYEEGFNLIQLPVGIESDVLERAVSKQIESPAGEAIAQIVQGRVGPLALDLDYELRRLDGLRF